MEYIILIPILFFSIVLHEFAHGFAAYRMGDNTAYYAGRLTLNPLAHVDVMGTLVVPAACYFLGLPMFGWAKPVPVNPLRLPSPRRDMGKVALAGPAMNLLLALGFMVLLKLLVVLGPHLGAVALQRNAAFLQYGVFVNILLAVFNLIPIPPLDGGRIATAVLPVRAALKYEAGVGRYGMWIVFGLILTGGVKYILVPVSGFIYDLLLKIVGL